MNYVNIRNLDIQLWKKIQIRFRQNFELLPTQKIILNLLQKL